ncbi:MAG: copper chaperone PCu(A)C [Pseudomonadota bacterium]
MLRTVVISAGLSLPSYAGEAHDHSTHDMTAKPAAVELALSGAFARATLPNQPVGGGFLQITNAGLEDDRLIAVSTSIAGRAEIHEMAMQGDTMKMREIDQGLPIPAGATVSLEPGGYHLMFMGLEGPLVEGERFEATLIFEKAGAMVVPFTIRGKTAKGGHGHNHGHGHGHGS